MIKSYGLAWLGMLQTKTYLETILLGSSHLEVRSLVLGSWFVLAVGTFWEELQLTYELRSQGYALISTVLCSVQLCPHMTHFWPDLILRQYYMTVHSLYLQGISVSEK